MNKPRFKNWRLLATLGLLCQTIGSSIGPTIAFAEEVTHPQTVTVELDLAHQYSVEGTFSDGRPLSETLFPIMQSIMERNRIFFVSSQEYQSTMSLRQDMKKILYLICRRKQNWFPFYGKKLVQMWIPTS